ncbi:MAG: alanine dehydrogenase [Ignavibacteriaceae bacterium]|jgi:L-alanine dehydrogenase (EC 1.4.1.1)|nr:MAG: alanine dehydrogenase [Chlorobiota bacterium]KXK05001.1 MAG: alanine dehydrogenase [Chlorobi bacterium OLB4]MBV6397813.1 Alanine dehydrogenase 2 [Ignavibacteria bacterium]MCC6885598.1 alanine dehydrogenase [Ignavibacteriales bacterium]MCE7952946.1 alanine dehydrogenase [Chlorobi bacterium CHB7]MDL1887921.1 alanine dehydrogenase [Ignavibacteria bacterium CHB1]MEB2330584.1 alanine dehydrogenase [Ignavibacteriaceae bacterium]OQY78618.1 MAG: alanine dehydrogenase [Ignavibacteriales bacte
MIIGVPKEIKTNENRVALTPGGAEVLKQNGHKVYVETNAGIGSGYTDADYKKAGALILKTSKQVFDIAEMIMKVKEPIKPEYKKIKKGQIVFTYFHFASSKELTKAMVDNKCISIAYETVQKSDGSLPLLIPMSEVAGRMAAQEGAKYLEKVMGGRGVLLGGVPGTEPAEVIVLGGGIVGTNAAKIAAGFGARVTIMDNNLYRLRYLDDIMPKNVTTMMSSPVNIRQKIKTADLVIGAVLIAGAKAPKLVTRDMLKLMKKGAVVVDVSVDQGGCIETCKPTTHENPTFVVDDIVHYCVANMPGGVPFTSTIALTNATLPYALQIANLGWFKACTSNEELKFGLNTIEGKIVYKAVANAFNFKYSPVEEVLKEYSE